MKIALAYTVYNGLELLEPAIKQHRHLVDELIICYQTTSNKGHYSIEAQTLSDELAQKYRGISIVFAPDLRLSTKQNEIAKHNRMLNAARALGCTHIIMSATDHFYAEEQFTRAINECIKEDYSVSFTKMYTYFKKPTWQLTPMEEYYMPFLIKILQQTKFERTRNHPVYTDPSVQVNTCWSGKVFEPFEICMHHYSMVRHNLEDKFKNAAASIRWSKAELNTFIDESQNYDINKNPGVKYFQGRRIKIVEDYFELESVFTDLNRGRIL